ncbi:MAG: acyl carrier protein [Ruminococcaceae bacterium]|nr:acyl carrier protein [Oscillospiraceae bacterium]
MQTIIDIIKEIKPGVAIDENTRLLDDKILDSLAIVSLVAELGDEFDVDITARDIMPENFQTVAAIKAMIERLEDED